MNEKVSKLLAEAEHEIDIAASEIEGSGRNVNGDVPPGAVAFYSGIGRAIAGFMRAQLAMVRASCLVVSSAQSTMKDAIAPETVPDSMRTDRFGRVSADVFVRHAESMRKLADAPDKQYVEVPVPLTFDEVKYMVGAVVRFYRDGMTNESVQFSRVQRVTQNGVRQKPFVYLENDVGPLSIYRPLVPAQRAIVSIGNDFWAEIVT